MRSRPFNFRASSALMKAFGIAKTIDSADARPREKPSLVTFPMEDAMLGTIPMESTSMIDCDTDLIELPPVAPREVSAYSLREKGFGKHVL